jgi:hypothetical protein
MEPPRVSGLRRHRGDAVSEGRHATYAHDSPDSMPVGSSVLGNRRGLRKPRLAWPAARLASEEPGTTLSILWWSVHLVSSVSAPGAGRDGQQRRTSGPGGRGVRRRSRRSIHRARTRQCRPRAELRAPSAGGRAASGCGHRWSRWAASARSLLRLSPGARVPTHACDPPRSTIRASCRVGR